MFYMRPEFFCNQGRIVSIVQVVPHFLITEPFEVTPRLREIEAIKDSFSAFVFFTGNFFLSTGLISLRIPPRGLRPSINGNSGDMFIDKVK